jgi:hypothetical protein
VQPVPERDVYCNATYGKERLVGLDVDAVLSTGGTLMEERPRTAAELAEKGARLLAFIALDVDDRDVRLIEDHCPKSTSPSTCSGSCSDLGFDRRTRPSYPVLACWRVGCI